MRSFQTSIRIAATPSTVWQALIGTNRWQEWDPKLTKVDGELALGGRITITTADSSRPFRLKVAEWEPGARLVLRGGMPLGLFTGVRTYRLAAADDSGTQFEMAERYSGLLSPLISRSIPDLQPSFDAFAAGLKSAAEAA